MAFGLKKGLTLAAILVTSVAAAPETRDSDFRVADIKAQLLYERSGTLSVDLTATPDFAIWNTIIGAGSALEPANDILVSAVVSGPGEHNLGTPLTIKVRDERGKVIGSRTFATGLADKTYVRSLLLQDVGCAGELKIEAQLGQSVRRETLDMMCGE